MGRVLRKSTLPSQTPLPDNASGAVHLEAREHGPRGNFLLFSMVLALAGCVLVFVGTVVRWGEAIVKWMDWLLQTFALFEPLFDGLSISYLS